MIEINTIYSDNNFSSLEDFSRGTIIKEYNDFLNVYKTGKDNIPCCEKVTCHTIVVKTDRNGELIDIGKYQQSNENIVIKLTD